MLARGATANLIFEFQEEVVFDEIAAINLYILGVESGAEITKIKGDMVFFEENCVLVKLSQEETIKFRNNEQIEWQFHWRINNADEDAFTSEIEELSISEFLGSAPI